MNFSFCATCGHKDTQHIGGFLCADEGCGCVHFHSELTKNTKTLDAITLELLNTVRECEIRHAEGFDMEERINLHLKYMVREDRHGSRADD